MDSKPFPFQKRVMPDEVPTPKVEVVEEEIKEEKPKEEPQKKEVQRKVETPKKVEIQKKETREKYTAMMDKELRVRLKIASVRRGIDVSKYIEEAVLEKLERDGAEWV